MKISDVCAQTGLTDRTIRFYIEKGILSKEAQLINGRRRRDYNEEDVHILKDISVLRDAGFSIQDILDMQNSSDNIRLIVEKRYHALDTELHTYKQSLEALAKIKSREGLSWRKLAELLHSHTELRAEDIHFRWQDNELMEKNENMEKERKNIKIGLFIVMLATTTVLGYFCQWHWNQRMITTITTLSDVTIHHKWVENGNQYMSITCGQELAGGYDFYFAEPMTLRVEDSAYYNAIVLKEHEYTSVTVKIEIPYREARKLGILLKDDRMDYIDLGKVLENKEWVSSYCTILIVLS